MCDQGNNTCHYSGSKLRTYPQNMSQLPNDELCGRFLCPTVVCDALVHGETSCGMTGRLQFSQVDRSFASYLPAAGEDFRRLLMKASEVPHVSLHVCRARRVALPHEKNSAKEKSDCPSIRKEGTNGTTVLQMPVHKCKLPPRFRLRDWKRKK